MRVDTKQAERHFLMILLKEGFSSNCTWFWWMQFSLCLNFAYFCTRGGGTVKFEISRKKLPLSPKEGICGDFRHPGLTKLERRQIPTQGRESALPFYLKGD